MNGRDLLALLVMVVFYFSNSMGHSVSPPGSQLDYMY